MGSVDSVLKDDKKI